MNDISESKGVCVCVCVLFTLTAPSDRVLSVCVRLPPLAGLLDVVAYGSVWTYTGTTAATPGIHTPSHCRSE